MTATCEHCQTEYDVDEARIPSGGIETLCRECGGRFWIRRSLATEPTAAHVPGLPQLPGYSVIRLLGKGGMATVYLARAQAAAMTGALRAARADLRLVLGRTAAGHPVHTRAKKALKDLRPRKTKRRRR